MDAQSVLGAGPAIKDTRILIRYILRPYGIHGQRNGARVHFPRREAYFRPRWVTVSGATARLVYRW